MTYVNMDQGVLLISVLVTSILNINGRMPSVSYEVVENMTTWKNAANACDQMNGTLIDSSEYYDNVTNITLNGRKSYWTSKFSFLTKWVEFKGCSIIRDQNVTAMCMRYDQNSTQVGRLCYAFCQEYIYFGITEGVCVCFSENPANLVTSEFNKCPSCTNYSRYQCGMNGYTAVYEKKNKFQPQLKGLCAAYNCQDGEGDTFTFGYTSPLCNGSLQAMCNDGSLSLGSGSWIQTRRMCEEKNKYIFRHHVVDCQTITSRTPLWDNLHREIASFTTGFERRAGLKIHDQYGLKHCSSITYDENEPRFGDCGSTKDGYICKIEHFTEVITATICNITETEPEISTMSSTEKDSSNSEPTTSISHMTKKVGNSTEADDMGTYIAIGAGVGGFLVVLLVIAVIVFTCRKRSQKSNTDENESETKKEIGLDDGEQNHMDAAERYVSIKSAQASVKYTVENGKAANKTPQLGKAGGGCYEQIVLPGEEPESGFREQEGIIDHIKQTQPDLDVSKASNQIQDAEVEDDYAEVDCESDPGEKMPEFRVQSASIRKTEIGGQQEEEDDYDHFGQTDTRASTSSNYDHVHLRTSRKSKKDKAPDDSEDYDHIPGAAGRREEAEIDSTYDHAQTFGLRESTTSMSSNYDHMVLMTNQNGQEEDLNRISDDYDHTNNVIKAEIADGSRDSYYTQVTLPDST